MKTATKLQAAINFTFLFFARFTRRDNSALFCNAKAALTHDDYKKMHAEATGISPLATDSEAMAAHQKHMEMVASALREMSGDLDDDGDDKEQVSNEAERRHTVELLVNDEQRRGLSYDEAFMRVKRIKPHLFAQRARS